MRKAKTAKNEIKKTKQNQNEIEGRTVDQQLNNSTHVLFNILNDDLTSKNKFNEWKLNGTKVNWGCLKGRG